MVNADTNPTSKAFNAFLANWRQNIIYIGFVAIFVIFALTLNDRGFLNMNNLLNIVRQTTMIAVMAVAMTFVLSAGEIDLSVGAVAGLASVSVAMAISVAGPFGGIIAGLATGIAIGVFNGWLTTKIGIPSFLTTLAMMGIAKGIAMWVSDTAAVPILSQSYAWWFGGGSIGLVPVLLFWMLIFGAVGHVVLRRTSFGRRVLATGGGSVVSKEIRNRLSARGIVVYLETPIEKQVARTQRDKRRPLLQTKEPAKDVLIRLSEERNPLYEEIADIVVKTDEQSARVVANEIINKLDF